LAGRRPEEGGTVTDDSSSGGTYSGLGEQLRQAVATISQWMAEYGEFEPHPSLGVPADDLERATGELHRRLRENYPFFHPRYVGQMLKPPHPAAIIGYVSAMLINPNNHALDGGRAGRDVRLA
jgi:hypothetical protein